MKKSIIILALGTLLGISCKKSSNTTNKTTSTASTASTQTVNVTIRGNNNVIEPQLSYKVNNGNQITLSASTAVTYTSQLLNGNI
jgi:uncharacterized lipoprotein YajG